jgi:hypothetical protein
MLTSEPPSVIVFDLGRPGVHGPLERDIERMPGQAFAPDVLGDEGAHLAQQRSTAVGASVRWREHHWTMDLGRLKAELDRLAGAIEHAGGRVTERDLNYVEDSAELFYERDGERYEVHLKRLPDPLPG